MKMDNHSPPGSALDFVGVSSVLPSIEAMGLLFPPSEPPTCLVPQAFKVG
jgi:hypothetical protein